MKVLIVFLANFLLKSFEIFFVTFPEIFLKINLCVPKILHTKLFKNSIIKL